MLKCHGPEEQLSTGVTVHTSATLGMGACVTCFAFGGAAGSMRW